MVGWHHQLNGHELINEHGQTLRHSERQESLTCRSSWGCKKSGTTYLPNEKKGGGGKYVFTGFHKKLETLASCKEGNWSYEKRER